jgi:hypothetical protein
MVVLPYGLPDACETEEVATLLAELKPTARRALRSYMHQVEFGSLRVGEWLASATCPVKERRWRYLLAMPEFKLAFDAYKRALQRAELAAEKKVVEAAQRKLRQASSPAAGRLVEQAEADISGLFKVVDRWTDAPLPSQEILQEEVREVEGKNGETERVRFHLVRQAVLDLARLADPRYARLIKKFSDSPRSGVSVEVYDAQAAVVKVLESQGMLRAQTAQLNVDLASLSDEQLERIAAGEDPVKVMASGSGSQPAG